MKNGTELNSRWYTGSGIYRDVNILIGERLHIKEDGVKNTTPDVAEDQAVIEVSTVVEYNGVPTQKAYLYTEIQDADGLVVASDKAPVTVFSGETVTVRQRVYVQCPRPCLMPATGSACW